MKTILATIFAAAAISVSVSAQEIVSSSTESLSLKGYRGFCEGVVPKKCLVAKRQGEANFRPMFDEIENFDFVPGFEYELRVTVEKLAAAPKDTTGLRFYLKEIISRKEVAGNDRDVYLFGNKWTLAAIDGEPVVGSHSFVVFNGHDAAIFGNTGCNSFGGTYQISGDTLRLSPLAITNRACVAGQDLEADFLEALSKADEIRVEPDRVYLKAAGRVALEFAPVL